MPRSDVPGNNQARFWCVRCSLPFQCVPWVAEGNARLISKVFVVYFRFHAAFSLRPSTLCAFVRAGAVSGLVMRCPGF